MSSVSAITEALVKHPRTATSVLLAALSVLPLGWAHDGATSSASNPASPSTPLITLVNVTDSINVTAGAVGTWNFAGQSITIPGSGGFANVRFNWYTYDGTATAFGTAYVLDREFLGLPGDLGPSTPGYVARTDATVEGNPGPLDPVKGEYVFPAGMTLRGGTKYWFYTNKQGSFVYSFDTDLYPGGDLYVTGIQTMPFRKSPAGGRYVNGLWVPPPAAVFLDANFRLQASAK
jgi:hypothetical protein